MTLRQQLQLKRTLRNLRTWGPPISIGVIIGAGVFMFADQFDRASAIEAAEPATVVNFQPHDHAEATASAPRRQATPQISAYSSGGHASASTFYRNCAAARADGASSIHAGQPGYAPHLDGDNDGVACEPYPR